MSLQINVSEESLSYCNEPAKKELVKTVKTYAKDIISEAFRLEGNNRTTQGPPELTSSHIRDSAIIINKRYIKPPKPRWFYLVKMLAILGVAAIGYLIEKLSEPSIPLIFGLVVIATTLFITIEIINE